MRSKHADDFNHDGAAPRYDTIVRNEQDPIRAGYEATLEWVAQSAEIHPESRVLELGSGSGNLTGKLGPCSDILCVDVSEKMESIAARKLGHLNNRRFVQDDILHVFEEKIGEFDAILSTYTIHHLTEGEKVVLFEQIWDHLVPGGRAAFGDLMLKSAGHMRVKINEYKSKGENSTAEDIGEEFFWFLDDAVKNLRRIGFEVETRRFSDLAFGSWRGSIRIQEAEYGRSDRNTSLRSGMGQGIH